MMSAKFTADELAALFKSFDELREIYGASA
jgi:hypothetical protein